MSLFLISVAVVLGVPALCSLTEAALYAVGVSSVRHLADSGSLAGKALAKHKANMESPIAAILILNTTANTAGAALAGYQATQLFSRAETAEPNPWLGVDTAADSYLAGSDRHFL